MSRRSSSSKRSAVRTPPRSSRFRENSPDHDDRVDQRELVTGAELGDLELLELLGSHVDHATVDYDHRCRFRIDERDDGLREAQRDTRTPHTRKGSGGSAVATSRSRVGRRPCP